MRSFKPRQGPWRFEFLWRMGARQREGIGRSDRNRRVKGWLRFFTKGAKT